MTSIIARSDAYNDNKVLGQAQALLETAKSIERIGPKMEGSIQKLDSLIQIALIPVDVIFESDELTEVTIFKVNQMGTFQQKIVPLRPGIYTVRGSRTKPFFSVAQFILCEHALIKSDDAVLWIANFFIELVTKWFDTTRFTNQF